MKLNLGGLHHVSALTANLPRNHAFYTDVLGLRLVKRTVNQDDPGMYHLFYADAVGTPGSEMTFFDFPNAVRERRGTNSITRTTFRVTGDDAMGYWAARLSDRLVRNEGIIERDGRAHLDFEDPDGTRLSLIEDGGAGSRGAPNDTSDIPAAYQIQGLGYSGFAVADMAPTRAFFERGLGLREARRYGDDTATTIVFAMGDGGPHAELHVTERTDLPPSRTGAGAVHHVALRVPDEAQLHRWLDHLAATGYRNSGQVNRYYFQSVYIRDPNGLVIELATDGPGFTADEPLARLGEQLALPPFLEPRRPQIEAYLKPLDTAVVSSQ